MAKANNTRKIIGLTLIASGVGYYIYTQKKGTSTLPAFFAKYRLPENEIQLTLAPIQQDPNE